ncbi:hypothetical protein [Alkalihalobacillus sp. LMS39]|uniref:hypothetical protein n=1 Tax=Alkalihalobacillus sp. LMS39 TaxID=2924032 RepID=UPI001FB37DCB|nr:hypothetical protein [Alkalihalobacillus sp. LMS39]UOE92025.1 hypothetical protein MM271_12170 [Alkalihalobacillus sp. LMS39]
MFSRTNQTHVNPTQMMGYNPFEYGLQQLPLHSPFFSNFFKTHPTQQQLVKHHPHHSFQMNNPFAENFMNESTMQLKNPFVSSFFQPTQANPLQKPTSTQRKPQSWMTNGSFDVTKMGPGMERAFGIYHQVKPMWNAINDIFN